MVILAFVTGLARSPVFFTYTGLRTDVGTISGLTLWLTCGLVVAVCIVSKFGGCAVAARCTGLSWRDSLMVGTLMNTRALMALIVINVGLDAHILTEATFSMLVTMAVVTTYMTTPLLRGLMRKATERSIAFRVVRPQPVPLVV